MKILCPECNSKMKTDQGAFICPSCTFTLKFEEDFISLMKERLKKLKAELRELSLDQLKKEITNAKSPATGMLIGFIAWGIAYFLRFPIFMAIVTALGFLLGPWGLVIITILPLVYKYHQETIEQEKVKYMVQKEKKKEKKSQKARPGTKN
ncbi:hypothetical protein ACFL27_08125 [candidate division CSSED10-310 bacterium]|uniref:Uncharacterized protein n=1 Tax=candidate division CSSED10-310 bacterium TaxID=2855610 RepID=A0ABV6YVC6_UNCC1